LHTHCPLAHAWPAAHAGFPPHLQLPPEQLSAVEMSQATQAPPPVPHWASEATLQEFPAQQPLGHDIALQVQAPFTHCWLAPQGAPLPQAHIPALLQLSELIALQALQAAPPVPQAFSDGTVHMPPEQQPFGHDTASHTQVPFAQCWPL